MHVPDTRYAKTPDGVYIAYQIAGEGPLDMVFQSSFLDSIDLAWDPAGGPFLRDMASRARVILHDRRGTGLSSRNVSPPNLETRVADLRGVLDAVGSERPVLEGLSEGGAPNVLFAASDPGRVHSLVWGNPSARMLRSPDYPWGVSPEYVRMGERELEHWGTLEGARAWAEAEAIYGYRPNEEEIHWHVRRSRHVATPDVARELSRIWYETDIRPLLPSVKVPTLLIVQDFSRDEIEEAEYIASQMPLAQLEVIPRGSLRSPEVYSAGMDALERFLGSDLPSLRASTVLTTILFTDIVDSTQSQSSLGDRGWKNLIEQHHTLVRQTLQRWHGVEADTAGDGFYATFDGPARAIRCALEITQRVRELGIEVRAGLHTGECEIVDGKCTGIAVSIGARVASTAGPSEVRVSRTVKDLVAGSGFAFEDAGEHELKGVPDRWRLYSVASG